MLFRSKLVSRIYTHNTYCTLCKKCMKSCPAKAINENIEGYPTIDRMKCIHCYRCIHHCPQKALSLSKRKRPQRTVSDTIGIVK